MHRAILAPAVLGALALAGCSEDPPAPKPLETEVPDELRGERAAPPIGQLGAQEGTPMEERVATIGLLNKRNNLTQDLEMKPGDARRSGDVVIRLEACERTAPYEMPQETGAFVQVSVRDRGSDDFRRIFSGWLFKNSPSLNVVEHPIYDVWVKDCAMSFPGEEASPPSANSE
ncbi:DUF2155 domain-containing protein [Altererythrobacter arenosus]|uniref:DUF2155 domain-containing protein n=1 Tax=Altererythrobacter arenosus TaxID=3032592 RepID=A0ABY8FVX5_9SPHN|nr:DUF2155 domain-containing protein [Altererythrobacter sp. CAU 1644]WFL78245.1 DUF2155 domain-containing protein [Altererythrobacter sp. CAU 1644]